jgi:hypothetical protein
MSILVRKGIDLQRKCIDVFNDFCLHAAVAAGRAVAAVATAAAALRQRVRWRRLEWRLPHLGADASGVGGVCEFVRVWCRGARGWLRAHARGWWRSESARLTCGPPGPAMRDPLRDSEENRTSLAKGAHNYTIGGGLATGEACAPETPFFGHFWISVLVYATWASSNHLPNHVRVGVGDACSASAPVVIELSRMLSSSQELVGSFQRFKDSPWPDMRDSNVMCANCDQHAEEMTQNGACGGEHWAFMPASTQRCSGTSGSVREIKALTNGDRARLRYTDKPPGTSRKKKHSKCPTQ